MIGWGDGTLDNQTGHFAWAKRMKGGSGLGNKAGMLRKDGYWIIRLDKVLYLAHRLVWLDVHGTFADGDIDHINGVRSDLSSVKWQSSIH